MVNWGIIGCGNVTEVKSGPAFNKVGDSRLVAVMRRNSGLAEDYARRHNVPKFYSDADHLINDSDVDAVYIATPPGNHMEYALRVIEAGKPVYIEKPMALNYSECEIINNAAAKKGVPVFVAYYRRTLPGFLTIKDIIDSGSIGKVLFVKIELFKYPSREEQEGNLPWRVIPEISGGGHFFDLACHQLDYLDYVFGPVQEVKSVVKSQAGLYNAEDFVSAEFVFPGNVVASGIWSFAVSPESSRDSLEIIGTKGSINSSTFSFEPITLRTSRGIQTFTNERPENVQYYLISSIVRSILTKSASPSTGETAARTSRVMDEVVKDYYRNLQ